MDFADPETAPTILPFRKFEIIGESEMLWAPLHGRATTLLALEPDVGFRRSSPRLGVEGAAIALTVVSQPEDFRGSPLDNQ